MNGDRDLGDNVARSAEPMGAVLQRVEHPALRLLTPEAAIGEFAVVARLLTDRDLRRNLARKFFDGFVESTDSQSMVLANPVMDALSKRLLERPHPWQTSDRALDDLGCLYDLSKEYSQDYADTVFALYFAYKYASAVERHTYDGRSGYAIQSLTTDYPPRPTIEGKMDWSVAKRESLPNPRYSAENDLFWMRKYPDKARESIAGFVDLIFQTLKAEEVIIEAAFEYTGRSDHLSDYQGYMQKAEEEGNGKRAASYKESIEIVQRKLQEIEAGIRKAHGELLQHFSSHFQIEKPEEEH